MPVFAKDPSAAVGSGGGFDPEITGGSAALTSFLIFDLSFCGKDNKLLFLSYLLEPKLSITDLASAGVSGDTKRGAGFPDSRPCGVFGGLKTFGFSPNAGKLCDEDAVGTGLDADASGVCVFGTIGVAGFTKDDAAGAGAAGTPALIGCFNGICNSPDLFKAFSRPSTPPVRSIFTPCSPKKLYNSSLLLPSQSG